MSAQDLGGGMRSMTIALTLCLIAGCGGASNENSPVRSLGTDQLVFGSNRNGNLEIYVMKTDGSSAKQLTQDSQFDNWWPKISPDRKKILFYRAPRGKSENYSEASLWLMNSDGSQASQLRAKGTDGWSQQGHAEWSPDGSKIAMFGSAGATLQVFVTDSLGKNPVQHTNFPGINTDVAWSPDGKKLLFNGCPVSPCAALDLEIFVMPAQPLASATRLTNNRLADYDPYFSPDGTRVAWLVKVDPAAFPVGSTSLGKWAIRIADSDGQNARDLINDGQVNSKPAWRADGKAIFFIEFQYLFHPSYHRGIVF
jgi:Tol biopolymer transport system component